MDGVLLVDKPTGWTSHDVVAKIRGLLRQNDITRPKVGHTGTLDPLATGLLIILLGSYCKRAQQFSELDKTYEVTMKLGEISSTGDEEGKKKKISDKRPSLNQIEPTLISFMGKIDQKPPAYSAIKVAGRRAYQLARAGEEVKLESRKVEIYSISDIKYQYPQVKFTTRVSSGTYIRSLVEDVGKELSVGGYTEALNRTKINKFELKKAIELQALTFNAIKRNIMLL